jgi:hypothetical protein
MIEHLADPLSAINSMRKLARCFVVLFAPYDEHPLSGEHLFRFTPRFIRGLRPLLWKRIVSRGWPGTCFIAVLKGEGSH